MTAGDSDDRIRKLMREGQPELPRRFYKMAGVTDGGPGFAVVLDGRPVRTPGKLRLEVPTNGMANAIALEWDAQGERINPATMPLTRLANTVLDGVVPQAAKVADEIVSYSGNDLLCYRAETPQQLVALQNVAWDPVLAWAAGSLDAHFEVTAGIMPIVQPAAAVAAVRARVEMFGPFQLAPLHVIVTLTGSALLALAIAEGELAPDAAWSAAHVDEDWQISQWGADEEASQRRERRQRDFLAACRFLELAR